MKVKIWYDTGIHLFTRDEDEGGKKFYTAYLEYEVDRQDKECKYEMLSYSSDISFVDAREKVIELFKSLPPGEELDL